MRIALLSDVHGNRIALDAVLAHLAAQGGADAIWVLGDLAAIGPQPVQTLERLAALPNSTLVGGNTDRFVVTGARPFPTPSDVRADGTLLEAYGEVAATFAWTAGAVTAVGGLPFLEALPPDARLTLPDGSRLLGVHAAPGDDDGPGLNPTQTDAELEQLLAGCEADLVCAGHTHWPMDRWVNGRRVVNLGSVSNPLTPALCATYALLEAGAAGYCLRHYRVPFDRQAVIDALERVRHPARAYIRRFMRGDFVRWHWQPYGHWPAFAGDET